MALACGNECLVQFITRGIEYREKCGPARYLFSAQ